MFRHPSEFVTFKASPHLPGVELYSARLVGHAFAPHVHDGYSLGAIEAGVERFRYRGAEHLAPAGTLVLLNPDELTPHQYLQARAKSLLAQGATPSDAAAAVGLSDQSHLNRWFKRTYGVTPAQYQQQIGTRPGMRKCG